MKNVTISIGENVERFARMQAAKQSKSLSRFISDLLEALMQSSTRRSQALQSFLDQAPFISLKGKAPRREDIYDRKVFR
jgi:hypothetical protein